MADQLHTDRRSDEVVRLTADVAMTFQRIPPGSFIMGSRGMTDDEEPRHAVTITRAFYLGTYPVTQAQFSVWTTEANAEHENQFGGRPTHPAESIDWWQALDFCCWLNRSRGSDLPIGYHATLPTEAEWEYACRAGTDTEYYFGDGEAGLRDAGWFGEGYGAGSTHAVGGLAPNGFGLHDMHGNVWEWCWDLYDADAYKKRADGAIDPAALDRQVVWLTQVPKELREDYRPRVVRGGSWGDVAWGCRSAFRVGGGPDYRNHFQGFRVCLVPGPVSESAERG